MTVRDATLGDAAGCAAIYAPFVRDTAVTFEDDVPSDADFATRIADVQRRFPWLVATAADDVVGYAYAHPFHARAAYRWTCETSVYLAPGHRGSGVGRSLYTTLITRLVAAGYVTAVAGMTLPNEASAGLHRSFGFADVGVYRNAGFKLGRWHDVLMMQRPLQPAPTSPAEPQVASSSIGTDSPRPSGV